MLPIVIVDDVPADALLAERVFRQCRVVNPIYRLHSGGECLAHFESAGSIRSLLLLDLVMPRGTGVEVLRELKKRQWLEGIVTVMLSGVADLKLVREGYQLGAQTFLLKPLVVAELKQLMNCLTGVRLASSAQGIVLSANGPTELRERTASHGGCFERWNPAPG